MKLIEKDHQQNEIFKIDILNNIQLLIKYHIEHIDDKKYIKSLENELVSTKDQIKN